MIESRRSFLRALPTVTIGAAIAPLPGKAAMAATQGEGGQRWAMVVDVQKCIGCQACTVSCIMENAVPENSFRTVVSTYEVKEDKRCGTYMLPRLCNHCANPPCIPVCPVGATFQRKDGVVVVDGDRCVGCAYCVQACPYDARFINHETGKADKCTFCAHRVDEGLLPACVETCVGGARIFGDLNDPHSVVHQLLTENKVKVLKPEQGTQPHVFYLGLDTRFAGHVEGEATLWQPSKHGK
ncbi:sulfate reduction electron transfer complex DsrMKJOP subunit DsrO [Janthinobacterium sp.]|uniref:sulfate reduction electron transfer complex DsrMKJOP subunit DsrO n=1 Tax=Janthinobacterium sp. TaxID=1871054 RepID=UPI0025C6A6D8|nr:4Fe-4S dicluster domain-containing protein [Janthinobacterium sp.]NBV17716.1 4Fe-4S dicluster domain-containing protein [Janthinobacterium sp.]